jgi:LysM repeat protein
MKKHRQTLGFAGALLCALVLLLAGAPQAQPVAAAGPTHTVQAGDTLYSIALRNGTTVEAIMAANGLPNANIYTGQVLNIPGGSGAGMVSAPAAPPASAASAGANVYVVQAGDTLFGIATRRFGIGVDALMAANGLSSGALISVGQRLIIPGQAAMAHAAPAAPAAPAAVPVAAAVAGPAQYHTVRWGDTLTGIAAAYGVSMGALAQVNNLLPGAWVYEGQRLVIPTGAYAPAAPVYSAPKTQGYYHLVRSGENLTGICARYGTTVNAVLQANAMQDANKLQAGQQLLIPGYTPMRVDYQPAVQAAAPPVARSHAPQQSYAPQRSAAPQQSYAPQQPAARQPAPAQSYAPAPAQSYAPQPAPAQSYVPQPAAPAPSSSYAPAASAGPDNSYAPAAVNSWVGQISGSNCGTKDTMNFSSVLRVRVEGRKGQTIDVYGKPVQDSTLIGWLKTGTKPELGEFGAEMAPLKAGHYAVVVPSIGQVDFYVDGVCTIDITFKQVSSASTSYYAP